MLKIKFIFTISLLSVLIIGCSGKDKATGKDPITGKKKRFEVNIDKKLTRQMRKVVYLGVQLTIK